MARDHEHVTVTLDAETVERIQEDLDAGESVAERVRKTVERAYAADDPGVEFVDDCSV